MNTLSLDELYRLLSQRFSKHEKKLRDIYAPKLLKNATFAAKRIAKAIRENQKITIVGDYDVDGVTSSSIMVLFFKQINYPVSCIIPNRFTDGYGINKDVLKRIDADVVITVDNGITAIEAAQICKNRGIDLIITDHHTPSKNMPDAYAIINPKQKGCEYPFKEICGAQVAWLLLGLLKSELGADVNLGEYLDLVTLAVIADVMPLIDINRAIVKAGLKQMSISKRPAFIVIRDFLNKHTISSEDIAFSIAPRINAAGRLEDASLAFDFLTANSIEKAVKSFELLNDLNSLRQQTQTDTVDQASLHVSKNDKIIIAAGQNWHEGVVGIVASKLVTMYKKPAIVFNIQNDIAKGSARSLADVNIFDLIDSQRALLQKFGGHKMAAGLSLHVKDLQEFKKNINEVAAKLDPKAFIEKENVVGELSYDCIGFELLDILEKFEPYGEANPRPRFKIEQGRLVNVSYFGADKSHSRLKIELKPYLKQTIELIAFNRVIEHTKDKEITCSYSAIKNIYNGKTSLQCILEELY